MPIQKLAPRYVLATQMYQVYANFTKFGINLDALW